MIYKCTCYRSVRLRTLKIGTSVNEFTCTKANISFYVIRLLLSLSNYYCWEGHQYVACQNLSTLIRSNNLTFYRSCILFRWKFSYYSISSGFELSTTERCFHFVVRLGLEIRPNTILQY